MATAPTVPTREVITNGDSRISIIRPAAPIAGAEADRMLTVFDINHPSISPDNYNKADGAPLRVLYSSAAKLDISKRSHEDMGFWHRSVDHSEIIICIQGALRWETELGTHVLRSGQALVIPRGVAHRSALAPESAEENILLEIKVAADLDYVGPDGALIP
ncbi:AraC family ligand binding domain-containing protein [Nocardioides sp. L-11A]|uniref:AraC family ligand binding domain-containing protein n=1 Tax=Nocardioides sp. L-11A TaxID=3043848 RepID=UPI00249BBB22|nr:AraC family ligand binding domain-containing protein [Nocardioides sp. L-11A]